MLVLGVLVRVVRGDVVARRQQLGGLVGAELVDRLVAGIDLSVTGRQQVGGTRRRLVDGLVDGLGLVLAHV